MEVQKWITMGRSTPRISKRALGGLVGMTVKYKKDIFQEIK